VKYANRTKTLAVAATASIGLGLVGGAYFGSKDRASAAVPDMPGEVRQSLDALEGPARPTTAVSEVPGISDAMERSGLGTQRAWRFRSALGDMLVLHNDGLVVIAGCDQRAARAVRLCVVASPGERGGFAAGLADPTVAGLSVVVGVNPMTTVTKGGVWYADLAAVSGPERQGEATIDVSDSSARRFTETVGEGIRAALKDAATEQRAQP
jgi:hypothetical protein